MRFIGTALLWFVISAPVILWVVAERRDALLVAAFIGVFAAWRPLRSDRGQAPAWPERLAHAAVSALLGGLFGFLCSRLVFGDDLEVSMAFALALFLVGAAEALWETRQVGSSSTG